MLASCNFISQNQPRFSGPIFNTAESLYYCNSFVSRVIVICVVKNLNRVLREGKTLGF